MQVSAPLQWLWTNNGEQLKTGRNGITFTQKLSLKVGTESACKFYPEYCSGYFQRILQMEPSK